MIEASQKTPAKEHRQVTIHFIAQADPSDGRCGAAALCMVLRSLDCPCTPEELWSEISQSNVPRRRGNTLRMGQCARNRGLTALAVECRGEQTIAECLDADVRVIVNYRLGLLSSLGHYAVVVGVEPEAIVLHDPIYGPQYRMRACDFWLRWRLKRSRGDAPGGIVLAIGRPAARCQEYCESCNRIRHQSAICSPCGKQFLLEPQAPLGCVVTDCAKRSWRQVFCPHCDASLDDLPGA